MNGQNRSTSYYEKAEVVCLSIISIAFDTFKFIDRLEKAGLPREQAVAIAEAQRECFAEALDSSLATKADLVAIDRKLDQQNARLNEMELRLRAEIAVLKWMVGVIVAGVIALILKAFF